MRIPSAIGRRDQKRSEEIRRDYETKSYGSCCEPGMASTVWFIITMYILGDCSCSCPCSCSSLSYFFVKNALQAEEFVQFANAGHSVTPTLTGFASFCAEVLIVRTSRKGSLRCEVITRLPDV